MRKSRLSSFGLKVSGYLFAVCGVAVVTGALIPFNDRLSSTTVALALLLIVLFAATGWGSRPALLAALLGVACFNFFFLPPFYTFTIADPQNWVALAAFLITALVAGELSARAKRRAEEAEAGRREIERLYNEYRAAAERARQAEVFDRIKISARRADGEMIMIAVEDERRGIPEHLRERVFDKFFRATAEGAASLGRPKGLGMGLAIARGIVEAHSGRIWVENGDGGVGARLALTIPIGDKEVDEGQSDWNSNESVAIS